MTKVTAKPPFCVAVSSSNDGLSLVFAWREAGKESVGFVRFSTKELEKEGVNALLFSKVLLLIKDKFLDLKEGLLCL